MRLPSLKRFWGDCRTAGREQGTSLRVTTSIGIAVFPDSGLDAESLLRAADAAMCEAKAEGRRIFRYATPGVSVSLQAAE